MKTLQTKQVNNGDDVKSARLLALIGALGLSKAAFGGRVGLSKTAISQMTTGTRTVSDNFVYRLSANFPNVNTDWLLTGEGEMFLRKEDGPILAKEPDSAYQIESRIEELMDTVTDLMAKIEQLHEDLVREKKINSQLSEAILNLTKGQTYPPQADTAFLAQPVGK